MSAKLYSYQRCSMLAQVTGDTVRRQTAAAQQYAIRERLDYQDKSFSDLGISGWKAKRRSGLEAMIQAIETGEIQSGDVIFIENLDRLTRRGFQETNTLITRIVSHGVTLYIQSDNLTLNHENLNDVVSIVRVALMADLAFKESQKKSERLLEVKGEKRKRAIETNEAQPRKLPFWIEYNHTDKGYVFNKYVDIVKLICSMRLKGVSDGKITKHLNDSGMQTPMGRHWHESSVRKVYRHPAVYGAYQTMRTIKTETGSTCINDKLIHDHYPAVMSKFDYDSINPKNTKRGAQSDHNHLKRLVKCGCCDQAIGKKVVKQKGKEYINYFCLGTRLGESVCKMPSFKDMHKVIFEMTKRLKIIKHDSSKPDQVEMLKTIDQKRTALHQIQQAIMSGINVGALIQTSQIIEGEIKDLEAKMLEDTSDDADYLLLSETENAVVWNQIATRLIKNITVWNVLEPRRIGMGKSVGNWHIVIEQTNGYQIKGAVFGNDANETEDVFYMYEDDELMEEVEGA
ncbi:MAG: recombinase family protein [Plesiomonas shigelloides]